MALKVKATHPNYADGTEIAFGDYFLAKVGEEVVVRDEDIERYNVATGKDLKDMLPKGWTSTQATKADVDKAYPAEVEVAAPAPAVEVTADEAKGGENA